MPVACPWHGSAAGIAVFAGFCFQELTHQGSDCCGQPAPEDVLHCWCAHSHSACESQVLAEQVESDGFSPPASPFLHQQYWHTGCRGFL
jgi:hypothetical protein